ncbi:MAG: NAD(P)H-dependent glycerol-3-phosphate dehydrogenase [Pyrinomonadaceae bacterium]
MTRIGIIGAGNWGTALAVIAARAGHEILLWSRNTEVVHNINTQRVNSVYLSNTLVPETVVATSDLKIAVGAQQLLIIAVPAQSVRQLLIDSGDGLSDYSIVISAAKGIEFSTGMRISEVVRAIIGEQIDKRFVCLSGPSFAREVVDGHPTAIVAASVNLKTAQSVQKELSFENLRIYTNTDVTGTELGGSVKNVIAIAAGMAAGLGFGSNSIAALITRGLAEMRRLAVQQGARTETLMGLAGLGDLVLTCTGKLSRNRYVGYELGLGKTLAHIKSTMTEVAEGIETCAAVKRLADCNSLEMPITEQVHAVLYQAKPAQVAVEELMTRPLRQEGY